MNSGNIKINRDEGVKFIPEFDTLANISVNESPAFIYIGIFDNTREFRLSLSDVKGS